MITLMGPRGCQGRPWLTAPALRLAPSPPGNPGSATELFATDFCFCISNIYEQLCASCCNDSVIKKTDISVFKYFIHNPS